VALLAKPLEVPVTGKLKADESLFRQPTGDPFHGPVAPNRGKQQDRRRRSLACGVPIEYRDGWKLDLFETVGLSCLNDGLGALGDGRNVINERMLGAGWRVKKGLRIIIILNTGREYGKEDRRKEVEKKTVHLVTLY
jgi:hypothetical protein